MNIYMDKELIDNIITGAFAIIVGVMTLVIIIVPIKILQSTESKLLLQTVRDLRSKGELDEKKYNILKKKWLVGIAILLVFASLTLFIMLAMDKIGTFAFIFMLVSLLLFFFSSGIMQMPLLYTIGYKATAEVISGHLFNFSKFRTYEYQCKFLDESNTKHIADYKIELSINPRALKPSVGDKIEILYLKENPKISVKYFKQLEQKYNLRKI